MIKNTGYRKLGKTTSHRKAMLSNMAISLVLHEEIKTTLQMITITAFLALFALSTQITPETISKNYLIAMNLISQIGIIGLWLSLLASVWSATQYTFTFAEKLKKIKKK